ncbi:MAG: hypothetical protein UZ01_01674 [Candidatus Brocadia sinica]|nr:MAG: hypothetical protein UZ01_01674 [Candidatus Brocadia sinica]
MYPILHLSLSVNYDTLDQSRIGSARSVLSFRSILFLSDRCEKKHPCKLAHGLFKRSIFGRKPWNKFHIFCCSRFFYLVLQRHTVSGTFGYPGSHHIYLFRHIQHPLRIVHLGLFSFTPFSINTLDNLFLLLLYSYACPYPVLDI